MIICPDCQAELQKKRMGLQCPNCSFHSIYVDGVLCFPLNEMGEHFDDYDAKGLDHLYKYEQNHFWFKNRRRLIRRIFNKYVGKRERIMEIGAGTGNVSHMLAREGYQPQLGEIHLNGLQYAKKYGLCQLYQFDARKAPFKEEYDVVCMFDVLEHIEDEQLVIKNVHQMLKKEGKFILTVPAHRFLWGPIDVVSGHKRRYELKKLKNLIITNGFQILEAKHFFVFLLPFLFFRRLLNRKKAYSIGDVNSGLKINGALNYMFNLLLIAEYYLLAGFSPNFGGSIIMVARKLQKD